MNTSIEVVYVVKASAAEIESRAEGILLEQAETAPLFTAVADQPGLVLGGADGRRQFGADGDLVHGRRAILKT